MEQLLQQFVGSITKTAIGLWIYVKDTEVRYYALLLKKAGTGDLTVAAFEAFDELKSLQQWIEANGKNAPVVVGLDGKQVLIKQLDSPVKEHPDVLVKKLVPGAGPGQFLVNAFSDEQSAVVSLVRSEKYQEYLQPLKGGGINVFNCFIGPGVTLRFFNALMGGGAGLSQYGFYEVADPAHNVTAVKRVFPDEDMKVNSDLDITHHYLPAYCLAASFFAGNDPMLINQRGELYMESESDYNHKRLFKPYFTGVAVTLLAVFMLNVYFYMESARENGLLRERSASTQLLVDQYSMIRKRYEEKQAIVDQLNYSNIASAWISDQIGTLVPSDVSLTSIRINPLSKSRKDETPFVQQSIVVAGVSSNDRSFGEFVSAVSDLTFVEEIDYQHYKFNQSLRKGEFEVKLTYQTD